MLRSTYTFFLSSLLIIAVLVNILKQNYTVKEVGFELELGFPTVQLFGTKGQKFLHCPGTKGQWDKLKILPRDRTGQDFDSLSRSVPRDKTGQSRKGGSITGKDVLKHFF